MSSALGIMSSIRFPCWQSLPSEQTTRTLPTTMMKKEEVNFHVDFDDLDLDDEQDVDVDEDVVLPPITHLERRIDNMTLPKPPSATTTSTITMRSSSPPLLPLPEPEPTALPLPLPPLQTLPQPPPTESQTQRPTPITSTVEAAAASTISTLALAPAPPAYQVDWLDFTRTRSAHFIAEKTCEMICYLWFSVPSHARAQLKGSGSPSTRNTMPSATSLQLTTTPSFVSFMQKLLETTQVSQSVIVLSLHYIHRLKERNVYMPAQQGSEFRIAVAGLMMANKFLDDNTYTNKTWSEVSGISLDEINRMELEFLQGVAFNLYVDKSTYASWLNLLKGLVLAKERDARRWLKGAHGHGPATSRNVVTPRRTGGMREREGKSWHPHRPVRPLQLLPPPAAVHPPPSIHASTHEDHLPLQIPDLFSTRRQSADTPRTHSHATNAVGAGVGAHTCTPGDTCCRHKPRHRTRARSTSPRPFGRSSVGQTRPAQQRQTLHQPQELSTQRYHQETSVHTHAPPSAAMEGVHNHSELHHTTVGTKRSASDAFSPLQTSTSTHASSVTLPSIPCIPPLQTMTVTTPARATPTKSLRPTDVYPGLYHLQIPEFVSSSNLNSTSLALPVTAPSVTINGNGKMSGGSSGNPSPLEGLGGFERMSLGEEYERTRGNDERRVKRMKTRDFEEERRVVPQTLVAAYEYGVDQKRAEGPKKLFFYTLSCSPSTEEENPSGVIEQQLDASLQQGPNDDTQEAEYLPQLRARKAKLRFQAAVSINNGCGRCGSGWSAGYADLNGGCCLKHGLVGHGQTLPPLVTTTYLQQQPTSTYRPPTSTANTPTIMTPVDVPHSLPPPPDVPFAPFANAGPPGVGAGFYATPEVEMVRVAPIYGGGQYQQPSYPTYAYPSEVSTGNVAMSTSSTSKPSRDYSESGSMPPATAPTSVSTSTVPSNSTLQSTHGSTYNYNYNYSGSHSTNSSPYHAALSGFRYSPYSMPSTSSGGAAYADEYVYNRNQNQNRNRMISGFARY